MSSDPEPTVIIRKVLDSRNLVDLSAYLEDLHKRSQASQEHTKVLLTCYSKLKSDYQLKQFIASYGEDYIKSNVKMAIQLLRGANFYELAISLAEKYQKHECYFEIRVEDQNDIDAALDYMDQMGNPEEMATYMRKYGRLMLKKEPDKTIRMIKTICLRSHEQSELNPLFDINNSRRKSYVHPEEFSHIFIDDSNRLAKLLEQLVEENPVFATKPVNNLLLELHLETWRSQKDILNKELQSDKIIRILAQPKDKLDLDQALISCRNFRFDEGVLALYGRAKLYHMILQYHIDQEDSLKIIRTCEEFGGLEPSLYMPALVHYSINGDERLSQVLKSIEYKRVLTPMLVIDKLLESKRATLGLVKDYLLRFLGRLDERCMDNLSSMDQLKSDIEVLQQKIDESEDQRAVFHSSKCYKCNVDLSLPAVHFLCNHCYHQECLYEYSIETDECPICTTTNKKILDEIESLDISHLSLDEIEQKSLNSDDDVFCNIAKLFGLNHATDTK